MFCPKCGTTNPDDAKFCMSCQASLDASENPAVPGEVIYAGFWERFAALFIDNILIMAVMFPVFFIVGLVAGIAGASQSGALIAVVYVVALLGPAAYFILMESGERGATFGKRVLKLRVVDTGGNRIGKGRAAGRWVAHALSYITLYIGYFIQPFTGKKQALHDMVSGTVVVKTEKTSNTIAIVVAVVVGFFFAVAVLGILAAVAIPAYQDYIVKAKTSAAYSSGQQATTAVTLFYQSTGRVPATLSEAGLKAPLPPFLSTLEVNPNTGEVQLTFNASAPGSIANKSMVFTPSQAQDGSISWKCSSEEIRPNLLPQSCR